MITLNPCKVAFNELEHTYSLEGKSLSGITSVLEHQLFPNEFDGVSQEVLDAKAEFGHRIHGEIELHDSGIDIDSEYVNAYESLKDKYGMAAVANEYLVSDLENFASSIDIVMEKDNGEVWLVDTKTVYTLNREKVAWQLSIYKSFFERQNPHLKVSGIACLWFKIRKGVLEDTLLIDLTYLLKSDELVRELLKCEVEGRQYVNTSETGLVVPVDMVDSICRLEILAKRVAEERDSLRDELLTLMQSNNCKSFKNDKIILTRKLASTKKSFDSAKFKADHPDLYEQYLKESTTKESIVIKVYD